MYSAGGYKNAKYGSTCISLGDCCVELSRVGLLVVGVAYQLVPMFQLTPHPAKLTHWLAGLLFTLLLAIGLWSVAQSVHALGNSDEYGPLLGILMIDGFAMSTINGMLYKIVPFLVWFRLQSRRGANGPVVPNIREILPESRTRRQMWLHFSALGFLLATVYLPTIFTYPAALLFGASNLWLWLNIVSASRTFRRVNALIRQETARNPRISGLNRI